MKKFRITKYNPLFRNEFGEYIRDEWTSIYDIGKKFHDEILTEALYVEKENAYIQTIELLLANNSLRLMKVVKLEKNLHRDIYDSLSDDEKRFIENIEEGLLITIDKIKLLSKMILRELIWAKLESIDGNFAIEFGYDYYMYVSCKRIDEKTKRNIHQKGLFVEKI